MAYRGSRDNHFSFRVPQSSCDIYHSASGEDYIEVKLPGATKTSWYSFMVKPDQVCFDIYNSDEYNIIEGLNRNTDVIVSQKVMENDKRTTLHETRQSKDPAELMRYFADCNADNIIAARVGATLDACDNNTYKQKGKIAPKSAHYNPAQPNKFRSERGTIDTPFVGMNGEPSGPGLG